MSKFILMVLLAGAVTGCANAPTAPRLLTLADGTKGFGSQCNGARNSWSGCYDAAASLCPNGFEISDKEEFYQGPVVKRNLYFKCK